MHDALLALAALVGFWCFVITVALIGTGTLKDWWLMWRAKTRPQEFLFGERVRVVAGFYTGQVGTVQHDCYDRYKYIVILDNVAVTPSVFHARDLQSLVDVPAPERKIVLEPRA